jgi:hypothetical protein
MKGEKLRLEFGVSAGRQLENGERFVG